jgi:hypothetical protein
VGLEFSFNNAVAVNIILGVQKPHCTAAFFKNAICIGCSSFPFASPSMVVISLPSTVAAKVRQDKTGSPFNKTVQVPHSPIPQPYLLPVKNKSFLIILIKRSFGFTESLLFSLLIVNSIFNYSAVERTSFIGLISSADLWATLVKSAGVNCWFIRIFSAPLTRIALSATAPNTILQSLHTLSSLLR